MEYATISPQNYTEFDHILPVIKYCAEDSYVKPWELGERKIGDYEFIFVTGGTGRFQIDNRIYDVKSNDLILIKPGVYHKASSNLLPFRFLCIHFELYTAAEDEFENIEGDCQDLLSAKRTVTYCNTLLGFPEFTVVEDSSYLNLLLKRIINEAREKRTGFHIIIKALFTDILINLFRQKDIKGNLKSYPGQVQAVIDYIKINYRNNIHLSDLAEFLHLQPSYISNMFKKHTGINVTDFIKKYRLSEAKSLLLETDRKVKDIASSVGFCDLHYFSNVFKIEEGLGPAQYRAVKNKK